MIQRACIIRPRPARNHKLLSLISVPLLMILAALTLIVMESMGWL